MSLKNKIAFGLIGLGLILLILLLLITALWNDGGTTKEIFTYVFDISTTVTFWEALTILLAENKERRNHMKSILKKFKSINFHKK